LASMVLPPSSTTLRRSTGESQGSRATSPTSPSVQFVWMSSTPSVDPPGTSNLRGLVQQLVGNTSDVGSGGSGGSGAGTPPILAGVQDGLLQVFFSFTLLNVTAALKPRPIQ
jgi:hypothetical protein